MLPLRHRAVYVPEGQYHLPSGVTFTSKSVFLTGDGCENTELRAHSWLVEADDREAPTTVEFAPSPGAVSCITPPIPRGGRRSSRRGRSPTGHIGVPETGATAMGEDEAAHLGVDTHQLSRLAAALVVFVGGCREKSSGYKNVQGALNPRGVDLLAALEQLPVLAPAGRALALNDGGSGL